MESVYSASMNPGTDTERPSGENTRAGHAAHSDSLVAELERRIHELSSHDDEELGGFSPLDWLILVLLAVVVPVIFVIRFAP